MGQYGDFCGGVFSSVVGFFSIILLYKTLMSQNETLRKQKEEIELNKVTEAIQQLHSRYLHLMGIYENVVNSFNVISGQGSYSGKKAIEKLITDKYTAISKSPHQRVGIMRAKGLFDEIYSSEPSFFPVYFRSIYRILKTLDSEGEKAKSGKNNAQCIRIRETSIELIKTFRAQLTSYELVLLKYNSMLPQGSNSAYYIDKYNLLKHLLPLDLFEFRHYTLLLGTKTDDTNILLLELRHAIADILNKKDSNRSISSLRTTSYFHVQMQEEKLCVQLVHKVGKTKKTSDRFDGIIGLNQNTQIELLRLVISETLAYSQHSKLNKWTQLSFSTNMPKAIGKSVLEIFVYSQNDSPLQASMKSITRSQWENL